MKGETEYYDRNKYSLVISIHSPMKGETEIWDIDSEKPDISIHSPMKGETLVRLGRRLTRT